MAKLAERKKELRRSESGKALKKKAVRNVGLGLYALGLFLWYKNATSYFYYGDKIGYIVALMFMITGLVFIYRATRYNVLVDTYNGYYYWIYQNEIFTLEEIANKSNKTVNNVIRDINALINEGFMKNIHVNVKDGTIEGAFVTSIKEQILRKVIRCSGCGARNEVVENETRECEYCGRKLVYENR